MGSNLWRVLQFNTTKKFKILLACTRKILLNEWMASSNLWKVHTTMMSLILFVCTKMHLKYLLRCKCHLHCHSYLGLHCSMALFLEIVDLIPSIFPLIQAHCSGRGEQKSSMPDWQCLLQSDGPWLSCSTRILHQHLNYLRCLPVETVCHPS